ncbi:thiamine pyrophosphate-binding protein [Bowmanella dokdonensis]|nr:thiamine pyrophosphate-binding protein [Bowmanella dokdonensis]
MAENPVFNYEANLGQTYSQALPTLGQSMAQTIRHFGGNRVYGVGGDFAANLIKALEGTLSVCPSSNEMHGAFSACAQAETQGMGFCLTTYTVGSLPCLSAAALAMTESLPVVFISGAPGEAEVGPLAIHHTVHARSSWQTQYNNALQAFSAMGMRAERLQGQRSAGQPNMAGERFFQLVRHAWQHKQPVFVEIPRDQVFQKTQALKPLSLFTDSQDNGQILAGSELIARQIEHKLQASHHPLLYIGDGVKHNARLKALLIQFAERFNIPFATTWFAKGLFDEYHPLCLGAYNGLFSQNPSRPYIEKQMDYVLDVASSIYAQDTNTAFSTGSHFIEAFNNKTVLKSTVALEQDLVELFGYLCQADVRRFEPRMPPALSPLVADEDKLDFHNLAAVLNHLQQQDPRPYLYLPEVGNSYFASYGLRNRLGGVGRGWLTNPWYGAMGTSLPYARQVCRMIRDLDLDDIAVLITGDGGFHFQCNELIELQKDGAALIILYMRNNLFHLGKSSDAPIYYCNDDAFDVHSLISAYGGESVHCERVGDFRRHFRRFVEDRRGIRLIEIPCDPSPEYQCREIALLNLYIRSQNGDEEALAEWQKMIQSE